ncbi:MAG: MlaD family protein [Pseudobdellovibrionaceae bacterium]
MTSRAPLSHQMKVGLFVALGAVILASSIFLVGGNQLLKTHVRLYSDFESVQGLSEGSVVSVSGITVGNVEKFIFLPEQNKLRVEMKVDAEFLSRITDGSSAEIRTQGALGDKFIYVNPGPPSNKPMKDGDQIEVVNEKDLLAVISEKGNEAGKIFDIIKELDKFSKTLNDQGRTTLILKNLAETSQDLKAAAKDSREVVAHLKSQDSKKISAAVDKLDRILTKIDRGDGTLGALINDPSLHESLKSIVGATDKKKGMKSLIRSSIEKSEEK